MAISRKLAILVFFGVPAIIGGGVVFHFFHNYTLVFVYEIILMLLAGIFVSR